MANGSVFKMNEFLCTVTSETGTSGLACNGSGIPLYCYNSQY